MTLNETTRKDSVSTIISTPGGGIQFTIINVHDFHLVVTNTNIAYEICERSLIIVLLTPLRQD